jgi:hypothetical protein
MARYFILLFMGITLSLFGENRPHLILHFDIHKTLISSDVLNHKSAAEGINELLAEKYFYLWDDTLQDPVSFDTYVRTVLVPGSFDDLALCAERREYLDHFLDYLRDWEHPLYAVVCADFDVAYSALMLSPSRVFPSFYRLIDELDHLGITYSIVLRSFGKEVFILPEEIEKFSGKKFNHPSKFLKEVFYLNGDQPIDDLRQVYAVIRDTGHMAIQDDWNHWASHGLIGRYAKPFYIDPEDSQAIALFFDDHIRWDDPATEINILVPINVRTGEIIPLETLIESGQLVPVNALNAILDVDYFLNSVLKVIN